MDRVGGDPGLGFAGFRVSGLGSGFGLRFKGVSLYRVSRVYGFLCLGMLGEGV